MQALIEVVSGQDWYLNEPLFQFVLVFLLHTAQLFSSGLAKLKSDQIILINTFSYSCVHTHNCLAFAKATYPRHNLALPG